MAPAIKSEMFKHIKGSMESRGSAPAPGPAGPRSSNERMSEGRQRANDTAVIRLDRIVADPDQPRTEFDEVELQKLAGSLKARGQLQPIRVRWDDALDKYIVVVGERRFRAAHLAGLESLTCVVTTAAASKDDILEDQLVENCLRVDLKPIEQARAFDRLLKSRGYTHRELAERLEINHSSISKALALLALPDDVQEKVDAGELSSTVAYEVTKIEDPAEQSEVVQQVIDGGLSRPQAIEVVRQVREHSASTRNSKPPKPAGKAKPPKPKMIFVRGLGKVILEPAKQMEDMYATLLRAALEIEEGNSASEAA